MGRILTNKQTNVERVVQPSTSTSTNTSTSIDSNKEVVNLSKKVYSKSQYEKVIDTKFSQLATTLTSTSTVPTISISEFFDLYNQLFFDIPKEGENNSHEYIIKTSSDYVNSTIINDDIQALIEEINLLQQTNLELNQQLIALSVSSSQT